MGIVKNRKVATGFTGTYAELESITISFKNNLIESQIAVYKDSNSVAAGEEPIEIYNLALDLRKVPATLLTKANALRTFIETKAAK